MVDCCYCYYWYCTNDAKIVVYEIINTYINWSPCARGINTHRCSVLVGDECQARRKGQVIDGPCSISVGIKFAFKDETGHLWSSKFNSEEFMSVKKKSARQKKILNMVATTKDHDDVNLSQGDIKHSEEAIRRQMKVIKNDYARLMDDVATGYGLIKSWVGTQAVTRSEMLKSRFIKTV